MLAAQDWRRINAFAFQRRLSAACALEISVTGGVAEWFKALVLKTSEGLRLP